MSSSSQQLGWIGLGNMGRGMVKNLVQKGNLSKPLVIHNRTESKAMKLSSELGHCSVATSPIELVQQCDIVFICLGDDDAVLKTAENIIDGVDKQQLSSKLIVDCSTIHPDATTKEQELWSRAGARFVACPVFGAPAMADNGQLVCVLAGPLQDVERVRPYCKGVMGRENIVFADAPPSKATHLKVIGNTFILSMVLTLSEGHTLAEKSGLGTSELHQFIEAIFPGPYTAYSNRLLSGDYWKREEPLFAVDLARKDARHARNLATAVGVQMKGLEVADEYLAGVKAHMGARGDIASVYGAKRSEAGLKFENEA